MAKSHFVVELLCTACFEEWEMDWGLGDNVVCPKCGAVYEAVWQFNKRGDVIGPWLGRQLTEAERGADGDGRPTESSS